MDYFTDLKIKCAERGTNLTQLCKEAGVDRSVPQRWKTNGNPSRLVTVEKLYAGLGLSVPEAAASAG